MRFRTTLLALCALLIPALLTADVTVVYKTEVKLSPSLPPALVQTLNASHVGTAPAEQKILVKAGKVYVSSPTMVAISDPATGKLTLLDPANKHYFTTTAAQFAADAAGALPKIPATIQSMMASMKLTADSKLTGRTAEIQGLQAEEHEITFALGIPLGPNAPPSPVMKVVMQVWMATPAAIAGSPALQEFVAAGSQSADETSPLDSIQKMLSQFPGVGDTLKKYMTELAALHSVTLRMQAKVYMPILAMMAQAAPAPNNPLGHIDPNASVFDLDQELAELSAAPVADSFFQIPDGYTAAPLADIMAAMRPAPMKPAPAAAPAPTAPR